MKFRKIFLFAMCAVMMLSLAACGNNKPTNSNDRERPPSPFIPYDNMTEAAKMAGFDMTVPSTPDSIEAWEGYMIQTLYGNDGADMLIRKAAGNDDISGDYNDYKQVESVNGVTLKGENGLFSLAVWTSGDYSYSISVSKAMSQSDMLELTSKIK